MDTDYAPPPIHVYLAAFLLVSMLLSPIYWMKKKDVH